MYLHVDLCCGLGGWQQPFRDADNWRSIGLDIKRDLNPDIQADVRELPLSACKPTLVTASPPCTEFSRLLMPWLPDEEPDMELVEACLDAVDKLKPTWWLLENSRGLHHYWREARTHKRAFYLWGEFPPFAVEESWRGKAELSGTNPEERARIPYPLADALRRAVEIWS